MGIPLSRFLREATSADIAEYRALDLLRHREENPETAPRAAAVATPKESLIAREAAFRAQFHGRVVRTTKG